MGINSADVMGSRIPSTKERLAQQARMETADKRAAAVAAGYKPEDYGYDKNFNKINNQQTGARAGETAPEMYARQRASRMADYARRSGGGMASSTTPSRSDTIPSSIARPTEPKYTGGMIDGKPAGLALREMRLAAEEAYERGEGPKPFGPSRSERRYEAYEKQLENYKKSQEGMPDAATESDRYAPESDRYVNPEYPEATRGVPMPRPYERPNPDDLPSAIARPKGPDPASLDAPTVGPPASAAITSEDLMESFSNAPTRTLPNSTETTLEKMAGTTAVGRPLSAVGAARRVFDAPLKKAGDAVDAFNKASLESAKVIELKDAATARGGQLDDAINKTMKASGEIPSLSSALRNQDEARKAVDTARKALDGSADAINALSQAKANLQQADQIVDTVKATSANLPDLLRQRGNVDKAISAGKEMLPELIQKEADLMTKATKLTNRPILKVARAIGAGTGDKKPARAVGAGTGGKVDKKPKAGTGGKVDKKPKAPKAGTGGKLDKISKAGTAIGAGTDVLQTGATMNRVLREGLGKRSSADNEDMAALREDLGEGSLVTRAGLANAAKLAYRAVPGIAGGGGDTAGAAADLADVMLEAQDETLSAERDIASNKMDQKIREKNRKDIKPYFDEVLAGRNLRDMTPQERVAARRIAHAAYVADNRMKTISKGDGYRNATPEQRAAMRKKELDRAFATQNRQGIPNF